MKAKELKTTIRKFKRECRTTTELGRRKKAWRVPGMPEAGQLAMLEQELRRTVPTIGRKR